MAITPVPAMTDTPSFPALADRADGSYNTKAFAFGTHMADKFNGELVAVAGSVLSNATEAVNKAADAATAAAATAADRVQTAADRAKTGQDVIATGLEVARAAAEADRAQAASTQIGTAAAFTDSNPIVKGSADPTKRMRFEVDGLTTGTTRVLTVPNKDGTLAMTSDIVSDAQSGDIKYSARNLTAEGYLKANGASYLQSAYPGLYAAVGRLVNGGRTWVQRITGFSSAESPFVSSGLAFGAGIYLSFSFNQGSPSDIKFRTSSNGVTWSEFINIQPLGGYGATCLVFANNKFTIGGLSGLFSNSGNGIDWASPSVMPGMPSGQQINAIAYGGGLFVAVGSAGAICTSPDGMTWTGRASVGVNLVVLAYGGGVWVAAGQDGVRTSTDGITWTARTSPVSSGYPRALAYGAGVFVITYDGPSKFATSPNGVNWTVYESASAFATPMAAAVYSPTAMVFAEGVFIAAVNYTIFISANGVEWRIAGFLNGSTPNVSRLCVNGNMILAGSTYTQVFTSSIYQYSTSTEFVVPELPIYLGATPYVKA